MDQPMNIAMEEAIARSVGNGELDNTVRLWRNRNAVVIGRFQCARSEVNFDACRQNNVDIIRRFTGGGAVYQDLGNLNFSISIRSDSLTKTDVFGFLPSLSFPVMKALKTLGLSLCLNGMKIKTLDGYKVSGLAGCIRWVRIC